MNSSPLPPQKQIVLIAIDGDIDAGTEFPVPPDRPLPIGRASQGLQIPDPLVSIHHARISYNIRRGYVIEDLESATGTWVDEECIKGESRPIGVGTVLRFGSTTLEIVPSNRVQPWMQVVAAISAGMLLFAFLVFVGMAAVSTRGGAPCLVPRRAERIDMGTERTSCVDVPTSFLRERGLSVPDVSIKEVSDYDKNGVSELWLVLRGKGEAVVTFGESLDDWKVLGEFPSKCSFPSSFSQNQVRGEFFPEVFCNGTNWTMSGRTGTYEIFSEDGIVVFYQGEKTSLLGGMGEAEEHAEEDPKDEEEPSSIEWDTDSPLNVGRFTLGDPINLGSFLVDRGITSAVHYVICETAFPAELTAQVLLSDGTVQKMSRGCINQVRLDGLRGRPVAFATSEAGRQALLDDLTTFFGGNPDGLFLPGVRATQLAHLRVDPGPHRGGVKLEAASSDFGIDVTNPLPDRREVAKEPRQLIELDSNTRPAPRSATYDLLAAGQYRFDPPGCAEIRVKVEDFSSEGWETFFPFTFLEVEDSGCADEPQRLFKMNYSFVGTGVRDANPSQIEGLNVRAVVETTQSGRGIKVIRARITYRDPNVIPPALNEFLPLPPPE
ncbi:MAG: FHA domain-containing protein [Myxococcota bacterium]